MREKFVMLKRDARKVTRDGHHPVRPPPGTESWTQRLPGREVRRGRERSGSAGNIMVREQHVWKREDEEAPGGATNRFPPVCGCSYEVCRIRKCLMLETGERRSLPGQMQGTRGCGLEKQNGFIEHITVFFREDTREARAVGPGVGMDPGAGGYPAARMGRRRRNEALRG